jgi:aminoglycoside phosphotransferase (APT) family kinase protein
VNFLAAGEYNENFLVRSAGDRYVFRINHGSQLELERQISYEFSVLQAVEPSGVTPRPFFVEEAPGLDGSGVLLMQFLPGRPLDYRADWQAAASIFAVIHSLPHPSGLVCQPDPVTALVQESRRLIDRFLDHPLRRERSALEDYYERMRDLAATGPFAGEPMCLVNTEVNSHNFLIDDESGSAYLVDWEKAVVSCRYQDLGHFVVPTTTRWKTNVVYSDEEKRRFLAEYHSRARLGLDIEELFQKTQTMERAILLRALSWCYMAYYEYTSQDRTLTSDKTFAVIRRYMDEIEELLAY